MLQYFPKVKGTITMLPRDDQLPLCLLQAAVGSAGVPELRPLQCTVPLRSNLACWSFPVRYCKTGYFPFTKSFVLGIVSHLIACS